MIDFTKEELIEILDYCGAWEPPGLGMSDFRTNLYNKIQSMIDNYCDHEIAQSGVTGFDCLYPCRKCGEKFYPRNITIANFGGDDDNK
jgi:hypothetical protein